MTFVVMSEAATREPHRLIAATVGVAIPRNRDLYGYLSEHHIHLSVLLTECLIK